MISIDFVAGLIVAGLLFTGCILFMYFWNHEEAIKTNPKNKKIKDYSFGEEVGFHYADEDGMIVFVRTKIVDGIRIPNHPLISDQEKEQ